MSEQNQELCLALMHAEDEDDIVEYLAVEGYWDNSDAWEPVGGNENNFSVIGNQQSDPVAALVEKIVNSIDARLLGECRARGIDPEGPDAPQSSREAVARFFEGRDNFDSSHPDEGLIIDWTGEFMTEQSRQITVTASGARARSGSGYPSISIADTGEGQSPDAFPQTLMSLSKSNKLRIPFVQGKFNMGGTGALQFCGTKHNFQLVVSRRRPDLLDGGASARDHEWGFTIVRRRDPDAGSRNSVFEYLAPHDRTVLSFRADSLEILPHDGSQGKTAPQPYARSSEWGTLIKLYSYRFSGDRSAIIGRTGLAHRVEAMLPRAILPMFFVDARYDRYGGLPVFGVQTRLDRETERVLEAHAPVHGTLALNDAQLPVAVYVFQAERASTYRPSADHAVAFTQNGQTHAWLTSRFFHRQAVKLRYLANDLFVVVDCSPLAGRLREDLFLNSRDRMRAGNEKLEIENALEQFLRGTTVLSDLQQARREAALMKKLDDQGVTRNLATDIVQRHSVLRRALAEGIGIQLKGRRISMAGDVQLKRYPDYFDLVRPRVNGETASASVAQGSRVLLEFETNADDDYFDDERGSWSITLPGSGEDVTSHFNSRGPTRGEFTVWANDLTSAFDVGQSAELLVRVSDDNPDRIGNFEHLIRVQIKERPSKSKRQTPVPPKPKRRDTLDLPNVIPVWANELVERKAHGIEFSDRTAVEAMHAGDDAAPGRFDLYVYMNNKFLNDARGTTEPNSVIDSRWISIMTLLSMGYVVDRDEEDDRGQRNSEDVEQLVRRATRSAAPLILHLEDVFAEDIPGES